MLRIKFVAGVQQYPEHKPNDTFCRSPVCSASAQNYKDRNYRGSFAIPKCKTYCNGYAHFGNGAKKKLKTAGQVFILKIIRLKCVYLICTNKFNR